MFQCCQKTSGHNKKREKRWTEKSKVMILVESHSADICVSKSSKSSPLQSNQMFSLIRWTAAAHLMLLPELCALPLCPHWAFIHLHSSVSLAQISHKDAPVSLHMMFQNQHKLYVIINTNLSPTQSYFPNMVWGDMFSRNLSRYRDQLVHLSSFVHWLHWNVAQKLSIILTFSTYVHQMYIYLRYFNITEMWRRRGLTARVTYAYLKKI